MSVSVSLEEVLANALRLPLERIDDSIGYQLIPQWDSANHVALIGALEDAYGITIDDDDIPDLTSVSAIRTYVHRHTAR
ncbi:phosphopantetheine-binding protein [Gemmatimonas aurantiaca]|uniref:phosphopantetheine-binding protein n=1 Tax=Gemmatimonas aurantiaca TaxID=173480 RepID=UPI00301C9470